MSNIIDMKNNYAKNGITKQEYISKMYDSHKSLFTYSKFIKNTDISRILIEDDTVIMVTRDLRIKLICKELDERTAAIEILNFNDYEKAEINIIIDIIRLLPRKNILDIGANIGYISLVLSKTFKDSKIYSFEPIKSTYDILEKNIKLNNANNVFINNYGLSDLNEIIDFYYYPEGSVNTSMANLTHKQNITKIKAQVKRLDDISENLNLSIDFIKCDVEGSELFVFKGGQKVLSTYKPIIYTELLRKWSSQFNYIPNDVINLLADIGYKCYIIKDERLLVINEINDNTVETNLLFLHSENHKNIIKDFTY